MQVKVEIQWLGETIEANFGLAGTTEFDGSNIETPAYWREFTEAEYAAAGGSMAVMRKFTCRCPGVTVTLPDGRRLEAAHSDARWEGEQETGYRLVVTRVEAEPFEGVE